MATENEKNERDWKEDKNHVTKELHRVHDRLMTLPLGGMLGNIREPLADLVKAVILALTGEPYQAPAAPPAEAHAGALPPGGAVQMIPGAPMVVGGQVAPAVQMVAPAPTAETTGAQVYGGGPSGQVSAVHVPGPSAPVTSPVPGTTLPPGATVDNSQPGQGQAVKPVPGTTLPPGAVVDNTKVGQ